MCFERKSEPPSSANALRQPELDSENTQGTDEFPKIWKRAVEAFHDATGLNLEEHVSSPATNETIKARVDATNEQDKQNLKDAVGKNIVNAFSQVSEIAADVASNVYPPAKVCFNAAKLLYEFVQNYSSSLDIWPLRKLLDDIGNDILILFQEISQKRRERGEGPSSMVRIFGSMEDKLKTLMAYFIEICAECAKLAKKPKGLRAKCKRFLKGAMNAIAQDEAVQGKKKDIKQLREQIRGLIANGELFMQMDTNEKVRELTEDNAKKQKKELRDSSINRIRTKLPYEGPDVGYWRQVQINLEQSVGDSTFGTWIQKNQSFSRWASASQDGSQATFALKSRNRTGASYLSRRAIEELVRLKKKVAWVYCESPEGVPHVPGMKKGSISIHDALTALVWQLVQEDTAYREFVSQNCEQVAGVFDTRQLWNRLFMGYLRSKDQSKTDGVTKSGKPTKQRRKTFFLVIDGLDLADGNAGNQGCKSMLNLMIRDISKLRGAENHIRLLITGSPSFFEELGMKDHLFMLDLCNDGDKSIRESLAEDHATFIRFKLDKVFSKKPPNTELLKQKFENKLVQENSYSYSDLQLIFDNISKYPNEELKTLLNPGQLLPPRLSIGEQLRDQKLSEEDTKNFNEMLPWLVLRRDDAWPTLEELEVVLWLKHGHVPKQLAKRIETTYPEFLSIEGNRVEAPSVKEYYSAHTQESPGSWSDGDETPDPKEIEVMQNFLKSFSGGQMYERFGFEKLFKDHYTKRAVGIHYTHVDGHMRIILSLLRSFCPENREHAAILHDYAVENLAWHLGQVKDAHLSRAPRSMKLAIGRWLHAFFLHEGFVRVWLTPHRLATVLSKQWWKALDEVLRWFQDPTVGEGARALLGQFEGMIVLERKDLLLQASKVLASEWLEKTEWDALQALGWILQLPKELSGGFFLGSAEEASQPSHGSENRLPLDTIIEAEKWAMAQIGRPNLELSSIRVVETMAALNYWEVVRDRCEKTFGENERNWKALWYLARAQANIQPQDDDHACPRPGALENFERLIRRFLDSPDLRRTEAAAWKKMWNSYRGLSEDLGEVEKAMEFWREIFLDQYLDDYQLISDIFDRMCSRGRWPDVEDFLCKLAHVSDSNNGTLLAGLLRARGDSNSEEFHQNVWLSLRKHSRDVLYGGYRDARAAAKSEPARLAHLRYYHALALFYDDAPEGSAPKDRDGDLHRIERAIRIWRKNFDERNEIDKSLQIDVVTLIWGKTMGRVGLAYVELLKRKPADADRHLKDMKQLMERSDEMLRPEDAGFAVLFARAYRVAGKHGEAKASVKRQFERAFQLLEDETPYNDCRGYAILAQTMAPLTKDDKDVLIAWHLAMKSSSANSGPRLEQNERRVEANDDDTDTEAEDADAADTEREDKAAQDASLQAVGICRECDGRCGKTWTGRFDGDMWVCRECADRCFDQGCMEKLRDGQLVRRVCDPGHVKGFVHVKKWSDQVEADEAKVDDVGGWLEEVKAKAVHNGRRRRRRLSQWPCNAAAAEETMAELLQSLAAHPYAACAAAALLYCLCVAVYRLYLSPLASFPGPTLAALTLWYEYYYDGIKGGQYTFKLKELHRQYGPIIRISPHELHVSDPAFIDTLYASGPKAKRDKHAFYTRQFGLAQAGFGSVAHDLHRLRRAPFNRFFSRQSVHRLEPQIRAVVDKLCAQLERNFAQTACPVNLPDAFGCMATDVVSRYAFGYSYDFLASDDFLPNLTKGIDAGMALGATVKQWPWLLAFLHALPEHWTRKLMPDMAPYLDFQRSMMKAIDQVHREEDAKTKTNPNPAEQGTTIFHEILRGDLPAAEKQTSRLWQEGQAVIGAGTETVSWALCVTVFHLLNQPTTASLRPLLAELARAMPDPAAPAPAWHVLEQLPYLSACIAEGLRLSYGLATRLARVSPDEPMRFVASGAAGGGKEVLIPAGVPVGMSAVLVHHDESVFPESEEFRPERWLDEGGTRRRRDLDGYLLSFSKGSRQCLGMNLAYAEMHIALATVLRRFGDRMELFDTTIDDVRVQRDLFIPKPRVGSKGVRVLIRSKA
ncbi:cytochrome p450 [Diplodia corticola]|uniref:Cytochrome p450 n=1 Tax=Diplodia corticola TaxID=236234 RepID=A0A1J9R453_9PEZI|nr:cytochrome p450 [Diplodia corticola]OJD35002.1 cytochrome p450 [Diplodia corticola]